MTWLARNYSPEQADRVDRRAREGSRAYYASQFRHVFGTSLEEAWARLDHRRSARSSERTWRRSARTRSRRPATSRRARSARCRARTTTTGAKTLYAALNYPGVVAHIGAISTDDRRGRRGWRTSRARRSITVTSLACDPQRGHALLHDRQRRVPRPRARSIRASRKVTLLQKDARIGDLAFNRADRALWGIRTERAPHAGADSGALHGSGTQVHTFPYGTVVYDLDVSPDGTQLVGVVRRDHGASSTCACCRSTALQRGDATPVAEFDFGTAVPNNFVFSPDGRYLYGSSYYTGVSNIFRYEIATQEARGGDQHRDRLLPAHSARRRRADRVPLHRRGLRAGAHRRRAARGRQRHHVPRRAAGRGASRSQAVERRLAGEDSVRHDADSGRACITWPAACAASRSIRSCRATRTRRRSACG